MKQLTLGSLFDGIGGWQIAAVRNGVKPIWSSEIEKFPLALTKARFPDTEQLGDVTKIDGTKIEAPDILTAGSPCQNLSVAGNREGLAGGQSGLFRDSIRIIRQLRGATNGRKTRFFVWENVPGAFTSGSERGADFRAVLESLAETDIPMPKDGRWAEAGMVQCPNCEIAWRTLDAQYWLPQRRKRIFLVADFAESDRRAAKILFVSKGVSGDTESCGKERERTPSTAEKSVRTASEIAQRGGTSVVKIRSGRDDGKAGKGALIGIEQSFTLGCGNDQTLFQERKPIDNLSTVYPLEGNGTRESHRGPGYSESDKMFTLYTAERHAVAYCMGHDERHTKFLQNQANPLTACDYKQPQIVAYCIAGNMVDRETKQHGTGVSQNVSATLTATDRHAVCTPQSVSAGFARGQSSNTRGIGYKEEQSPTVIAGDVPLVMSAPSEQNAYAIGNGQTDQLKMQDKVGTLNCMHDQIAVMQPISPGEQKEEKQDVSQDAYCVGDGQLHQMYLSDKIGALNCMHNGGQKVLVPYQKTEEKTNEELADRSRSGKNNEGA